MELESCKHWSLKLEHVTLQLWICSGTFGRNFRDKWGHNFAAIICSQYLGEFYPRGGGCELKSCKPWSLTGYYCIQMECVTLDRNANITCSIARMWANTARCSTMNRTSQCAVLMQIGKFAGATCFTIFWLFWAIKRTAIKFLSTSQKTLIRQNITVVRIWHQFWM